MEHNSDLLLAINRCLSLMFNAYLLSGNLRMSNYSQETYTRISIILYILIALQIVLVVLLQ